MSLHQALTDYPGLSEAFAGLGTVTLLSDWEPKDTTLTAQDRLAIVTQAEFGLKNVYAHLPLKRARRATDPLLALHLLRHRMDPPLMSDLDFHVEMMTIFDGLGDIHTSYQPPEPYNKTIAFLPFMVGRCFGAEKTAEYVLSRTLDGFEHESFVPGATIISWNGVPIDTHVIRHGLNTDGSNPEADIALSVHYLTVRWLGATPPPLEHWVIVGYQQDGKSHEIRLPWALLALSDAIPDFEVADQSVWLLERNSPSTLNTGINARVHVEQLSRRRLFASEKVDAAKQSRERDEKALRELGPSLQAPRAKPSFETGPVETHLKTVFEAEVIESGGEQYGYIGIRGFVASDEDQFVNQFWFLLGCMPPSGLIIDLRGNPGGIIQCAERCLQFLTPRQITPLSFQWIGSPLTDRLLTPPPLKELGELPEAMNILFWRNDLRTVWGDSIDLALHTGALYSKGEPLTQVEAANAIGQQYYGPVVLITDAITYSAGDMFTAGFKDHGIGTILGVDSTTGAGGANLWSHEQLVQFMPDEPLLETLPGGVKITYAVRRCLRGGDFAGMPIEELGVKPDQRHWVTKDDILESNRDLRAEACAILASQPSRTFDVRVFRDENPVRVEVKSAGVDRIDIYLGERPMQSCDTQGGQPVTTNVDPKWRKSGELVRVLGYDDGKLVASYREPPGTSA